MPTSWLTGSTNTTGARFSKKEIKNTAIQIAFQKAFFLCTWLQLLMMMALYDDDDFGGCDDCGDNIDWCRRCPRPRPPHGPRCSSPIASSPMWSTRSASSTHTSGVMLSRTCTERGTHEILALQKKEWVSESKLLNIEHDYARLWFYSGCHEFCLMRNV